MIPFDEYEKEHPSKILMIQQGDSYYFSILSKNHGHLLFLRMSYIVQVSIQGFSYHVSLGIFIALYLRQRFTREWIFLELPEVSVTFLSSQNTASDRLHDIVHV